MKNKEIKARPVWLADNVWDQTEYLDSQIMENLKCKASLDFFWLGIGREGRKPLRFLSRRVILDFWISSIQEGWEETRWAIGIQRDLNC